MKLTERENSVLRLIAQGFTDREIAQRLSFSISTARKHRENMLAKFQLEKSAQLVVQYFIHHPEAWKEKMASCARMIRARYASMKS